MSSTTMAAIEAAMREADRAGHGNQHRRDIVLSVLNRVGATRVPDCAKTAADATLIRLGCTDFCVCPAAGVAELALVGASVAAGRRAYLLVDGENEADARAALEAVMPGRVSVASLSGFVALSRDLRDIDAV